MTSINIFEVLFQLVLLGLIIGVIIFLMKKGLGKFNKSKRTNWIMGAYLLVLLVSVGLFLFIPEVKKEERSVTEGMPSLYDIAYDEAPVNIPSDYMEKQWEFDYTGNEITIQYHGEADNSIPIRIDTKDDDDKIEAEYYRTPTYFSGVNLTSYVNPVGLNIASDGLLIELPESVNLDFTSFKKEFPFKQFTEKGFWGNDDWMEDENETYGEQLLYLRIPENIKVNADEDLDISYEGISE